MAKQKFPLIEECLLRLRGKSVFTLLDFKDSFHQIRIYEDSRKYFAFATPDGQFEYTCLPFGFCEFPAEFQKRFIQILNPLIRNNKILIYIHDMLIGTETIDQNLEILKEILIVLKKYGFKKYGFKLNYKCQFFKKAIEFLGYMLSDWKITLSLRYVSAIENYKMPANVHEMQKLFGLTNYFRRFIKNYAQKARPLQNLLKKITEFAFESEEVFKVLKNELIAYPVLRLYNSAAETELHTDACNAGLRAILLQKPADKLWAPIAYFSQTTNCTEEKYHSFELEMLTIVRAVERFHLYLYGLDFTIVTDCNALVYAINKANLNPRIARWTLALQNYHFKVTHRPGKSDDTRRVE